jgi:hypothetical protein
VGVDGAGFCYVQIGCCDNGMHHPLVIFCNDTKSDFLFLIALHTEDDNVGHIGWENGNSIYE